MSTPSGETKIELATPADAPAITAVLVESFLDGPIAEWLLDDRELRREIYEKAFAAIAEHAITYGVVHVTSDRDAVALWYPMLEPPPEDPEFNARLAEAAGEYIGRYVLKIKATAEHHPTDPHHHLAFLGVQPDRQGQGLGSALLDAYHSELDAKGIPAFLEATNERNRALYLRHGYTSADAVYLPDDGPPMWPMWRPVGGAQA